MANSFVVNASMRKNLSYDPLKDFVPIMQLTSAPHVLTVHPKYANDFAGFLEKAKKSGKAGLSYGSPGPGTSGHLLAEEFRMKVGFEATHIPYKGGPPAYADLMAGRLDFMFITISEVIQPMQNNQMKALAIAGKSTSDMLPGVPSLSSQGYDVVLSDAIYGVVANAKMPPELQKVWQQAWRNAISLPENTQRIIQMGLNPVGGSAEDFGKTLKAYRDGYAGVVNSVGLSAN